MGKSIRKAQAALSIKEQQIKDKLDSIKMPPRAVSRNRLTADSFLTFPLEYHSDFWVRDPQDWKYSGRSKDKTKITLDLIRHLFKRYPAPSFLETAFLTSSLYDFIPWYITATQGGSLYKKHAKDLLSKKETFLFLQAPNQLKLPEAIWYARIANIADRDIASKLVKTRIPQESTQVTIRSKPSWIQDNFWISVMEFLARNPIPIPEANDLIDYFRHARNENSNYSLKGRTITSVLRHSEEWHRMLIKSKAIGNGSWEGIYPQEPWEILTAGSQEEEKIRWRVHQILTGRELNSEGQAMRHCVSSYKRYCMEGQIGIFSLTQQLYFPATGFAKPEKRAVTIEVRNREIIQARGKANRRIRPMEKAVLSRWAKIKTLSLGGYL